MSDGLFARIYIVLMCINIALIVFGGVTIYKDANTRTGAEWNMTKIVTTDEEMNAFGTMDVVWSWIMTGLNFVLLGGIIGMFAQAELPIEIQFMLGIPITALGIYAMYVILKAAAQVVSGAVGGVLSFFKMA